MKFKINILLIIILLVSCQSETEIKEKKTASIEKIESNNHAIQEKNENHQIVRKKEKTKPNKAKTEELAEIIIDDHSEYSKNFVSEISAVNGMKSVEFKKGMMILNRRDSIYFPKTPKLNQRIVFTGRKENLVIALIIKRINYTSIEYRLEMVEFGKSSKTTNGIADLGGLFFLGSESDTYETSNESYFSTQYSSTNDSCYTNIRIGNIEDSMDKPSLAKIVSNCNGAIRNIDLDNFPTLREK